MTVTVWQNSIRKFEVCEKSFNYDHITRENALLIRGNEISYIVGVDALLFTLIYSCFFSDKQLMTAPQCYLTQPELTSRHPRYRSSLAHLVCSCSAAYGSTCLDHPHLYCTCIRGDSTSNGVQDFIWHSLRRSSSDGCPVMGAALLSTIHSYSMQSVGPPKRW